jgi:carbohydrate diacid regulator
MIVVRQVDNLEEYRKLLQNFNHQGRELIKLLTLYYIKDLSIAAGGLSSSIEKVCESYHEAEHLIRLAKRWGIEPKIHSIYD